MALRGTRPRSPVGGVNGRRRFWTEPTEVEQFCSSESNDTSNFAVYCRPHSMPGDPFLFTGRGTFDGRRCVLLPNYSGHLLKFMHFTTQSPDKSGRNPSGSPSPCISHCSETPAVACVHSGSPCERFDQGSRSTPQTAGRRYRRHWTC